MIIVIINGLEVLEIIIVTIMMIIIIKVEIVKKKIELNKHKKGKM